MNPIEEALRSASTIAASAVQSGVEIGRQEGAMRERMLLAQVASLETIVNSLADLIAEDFPQTAETVRALTVNMKLERQA